MTSQGGTAVREEQPFSGPAPLRNKLALVQNGASVFPAGVNVPLARDERASSLVWREAFHRRLLAFGDVAAASLALVILLNVFGQRRVEALAVVAIALLLFLFKVAGLYDRDAVRIVNSTLDEVPRLAQLTGLFALGVAILQSTVLAGNLSAERIAALWIASFSR
jgi:hypothetical protein